MKPLFKGLTIAVMHLLLVSSLGAKLLYDRTTRPRVWVRTTNYDPEMPIRGRYVALQLEVEAREFGETGKRQAGWATLSVENDRLVAMPSVSNTGVRAQLRSGDAAEAVGRQLGIDEYRLATEPYKSHLGISAGIVMLSLDPEGAATRAGLREGDVVLQIGDKPLVTFRDLDEALLAATVEEDTCLIQFDILRDHDELSLSIPWERPEPFLETAETTRILSPWTPFFIPEHIKNPSNRIAGEELWVEVTIPEKGPPRPIRLGVRKDGGDIVVLDIN